MKVEDWIKRSTDNLLMRGWLTSASRPSSSDVYDSTWEQGSSPTTGVNVKVSNSGVDAHHRGQHEFSRAKQTRCLPPHSLTALACRRVDMIWDVYMYDSLKERGEYKAPCEEFSHQQC